MDANLSAENEQSNRISQLRMRRQLGEPGGAAGGDFVTIEVASSLVQPYEHVDKGGKPWQMGRVELPRCTVVDGRDVGGYRCRAFLSSSNMEQIAARQPVSLSFLPDEKVRVWKGGKGSSGHDSLEIAPSDLKAGVDSANRARAARGDERPRRPPHGLPVPAAQAAAAARAAAATRIAFERPAGEAVPHVRFL